MTGEESLLKEGRNCWRQEKAARAAFIIDPASYFAAFADAVRRARETVMVVGWDVNSRVALLRGDDDQSNLPRELGAFLKSVVSSRRRLRVYILCWDFSMVYTFDREILPVAKFVRTHRRIKFCLDDCHPVGCSHHQKLVVVDDALAFIGGMDLSIQRWDTPEHRSEDPLRVDPYGRRYPPHHDVQMAVDGDAAAALGELARERWHRATGKIIKRVKPFNDPWPQGLRVDARDVTVGIARTEPATGDRCERREVQGLYIDAISAARKFIYIENQYFTVPVIASALADQLQKKDGPEIVLVLPRQSSGWLEESTMGVLRARRLKQLRDTDRYGRLRACFPTGPGLDSAGIYVHSKVLVIDDRLVRIGSSNLNNRSMGLDTECDAAIEAHDEDTARAVSGFRNRLLAEHLGAPPIKVEQVIDQTGSLIAAIDELSGAERTLRPLTDELPTWLEPVVPDGDVLDPEKPVEPERLARELGVVDDDSESGSKGFSTSWLRLTLLLVSMLGLAAVWRWTPLASWVDVDHLVTWIDWVKEKPMSPVLVVAGFSLGSLILVPVTILVLATAFAFGPIGGFLYSLLGSLLGAALTYGAGRLLGTRIMSQIRGSGLRTWSRRVAERGVLAVTAVRLVPIAPFSVVNVVAGASHISFRDFMMGTALGMGPGILGLTLLEQQLENALRDQNLQSFAALGAVVVVIVLGLFLIRRWVSARKQK